MKASTLLFSLTSVLIAAACGDSASLGKEGSPVDNTGAGGTTSSTTTGSGGSVSGSTGGSSSGETGGSSSSGSGGSSNTGAGGGPAGAGGSTSGGTGGGPAGDGGADGCALVKCAAGTHCVLEQVACIQAPCPPQPTCVKDPTPGTQCSVNEDCRLFDNYCGGCACDALPVKASDPKCDKGMVQCLVQPCRNKTAVCSSGMCVAK
jgi:hypothetical protein